jgi:hypothetical protein
MSEPLDARPARKDLTDREVAKLLGAVVSGLLEMSDAKSVRNAVRWWANSDKAWEMLQFVQGEIAKEMEIE